MLQAVYYFPDWAFDSFRVTKYVGWQFVPGLKTVIDEF